jgi:hypothetical protein
MACLGERVSCEKWPGRARLFLLLSTLAHAMPPLTSRACSSITHRHPPTRRRPTGHGVHPVSGCPADTGGTCGLLRAARGELVLRRDGAGCPRRRVRAGRKRLACPERVPPTHCLTLPSSRLGPLIRWSKHRPDGAEEQSMAPYARRAPPD